RIASTTPVSWRQRQLHNIHRPVGRGRARRPATAGAYESLGPTMLVKPDAYALSITYDFTMAFTHPCFRVFNLDDLPLNRDLYLMDEVWLAQWEAEYIKLAEAEGDDDDAGGDPYNVGYISRASATAVGPAAVELCWYPNTHDRFHEVKTVI